MALVNKQYCQRILPLPSKKKPSECLRSYSSRQTDPYTGCVYNRLISKSSLFLCHPNVELFTKLSPVILLMIIRYDYLYCQCSTAVNP
jgi:hypothetical protein